MSLLLVSCGGTSSYDLDKVINPCLDGSIKSASAKKKICSTEAMERQKRYPKLKKETAEYRSRRLCVNEFGFERDSKSLPECIQYIQETDRNREEIALSVLAAIAAAGQSYSNSLQNNGQSLPSHLQFYNPSTFKSVNCFGSGGMYTCN